jgi:hypothetical protein
MKVSLKINLLYNSFHLQQMNYLALLDFYDSVTLEAFTAVAAKSIVVSEATPEV